LTATPDASFGAGGTAALAGLSLRGLDVDASGRIWVADFGAGQVLVVEANGLSFTSRTVGATPIDIAVNDLSLYGESQVLVTDFQNRLIRMFEISHFDANTLDFSNASVANGYMFNIGDSDLIALSLDPDGNNDSGNPPGALSGIVVVPNRGFYVTNENGQTADQRSIYGIDDGQGGIIDGVQYMDIHRDDNEPVISYLIPIPEPAAIVLGAMALAGFAVLVRRRASA
jgi:hypothetical protein